MDEGQTMITHALTQRHDSSEDGSGRGVPLTLAIRGRGDSSDLEFRQDGTANAILTPSGGRGGIGVEAVAIQERAVSENPDAGPDGAGVRDDDTAYTLEARVVPQAVAFHNRQDPDVSGDVTHPLGSMDNGMAVAISESGDGEVRETPFHPTLTAGGGKPGQGYPAVREGMAVRRLTPRECEALQGFPRGYTLIPWRGKPAEDCPDGPRYKALGNSMAVPVMRWIGERIKLMED